MYDVCLSPLLYIESVSGFSEVNPGSDRVPRLL